MKIDLLDVTKQEIIQFFKEDPKLCYQGLPDEELHDLMHNQWDNMPTSSIFKLISITGIGPIALLRLDALTNIALSMHFYLHSGLQGKGLDQVIGEVIYNYIKSLRYVKKVVAPVPKVCRHVRRALLKFGFKQEGVLKNAIQWRSQVTDLHHYSLEIK